MSTRWRRSFGATLLLLFVTFGAAAPMTMFPFNLISGGGKDIGIAFLKSSDAARRHEQISRQQQLAKLQSYQEVLAVRANSEVAKARERLNILQEKRTRLARGSVAADVNILITDREKIALSIIEMYAELQKVVGEQESLLKRFIGTLDHDVEQAKQRDKNLTNFSWTQFKEVQQDIEEEKNKRAQLTEKKDLLVRDGTRLQGQHELQNKQLVQKMKDLEKKISHAIDTVVREQYQIVLSLQQALQAELDDFSRLGQELHEHRVLLKTDELALQEYIVGEKKRQLPLLKERMVFSLQDIDLARQELAAQQNISSENAIALGQELKRVRAEKERLETEKEALDVVKVQGATHEAERERIEWHLQLLEQQRILLIYKHEQAEGIVAQKKLQLAIVEVMQQRAVDRTGKIVSQHIDDWLAQFHQQKERTRSFLEKLEDRAQENRLRSSDHHKGAGLVSSKLAAASGASAHIYQDTSAALSRLQLIDQEIFSVNSEQIKQYKTMLYDLRFMLSELEGDQRSLNIWQRSDKALSPDDLQRAYIDARHFFTYLYRATITTFNPVNVLREVFRQTPIDYLLLFFLFAFLLFFVTAFRMLLAGWGRYTDRLLYVYQGQVWAIYLTILRSFVRFAEQHGRGIGIWLFVRLHIMFDFQFVFMGMLPLVSPYTVSVFYLVSIVFFLHMSRHLMHEVKSINQRMSFLFFTETLQEKFLLLLSSILYSSAILLPLRKAFVSYPFSASLALPNVIYGAWTLILSVVFLLFFSKGDVLRITPSKGFFGQWLHTIITQYYYPVFFFIMGLFILVNPYVGYSNFAVYLAICLPASVAIVYALVMAHTYIRRYSMFIFIKEDAKEEDEGEDRFEHAKLYYGVFVLASFIGMAVAAFMGLTRIWGIDYTFGQLWKGLSQDWVLTIEGTGVHIGFGGLLTMGLFVTGAFVVSSLFNRFVLTKLFEIFRVEAGAQNTVTRLMHYGIIFLAVVFGLHAIKLGQLGNLVFVALLVGISFGVKDLVADFFAGFWILIERPIEPGNFIQTGELRGTVKKIAVRATTIRTARNFSVVIPNRKLVAEPIINWGGGYYAVGFEFKVSVSYHADPKKTQDIIRQVVSSNGLVLRIPSVSVRLDEFGDNGMEYFVRAFISSRRVRDQWDIASDIRIELMRVFQEHNIGIPYPHLVIQQENAFGLTKEHFDQMVAEEQTENNQ